MILGTGIDIIEIERVHTAFHTERRKNRIFTEGEIEKSGQSKSRLAGFYAAKEAFSKALGTGIKGISFKEIEVLKDQEGKPYFNMEPLKDHLKERFGEKKFHVHLTISHDRERAIAMVIIEEEK
ncbi:holo-ACP synthase [Proteiniclasticum sp. C24MP]|uniref:holo-ACP synthase n=1 Tax=Proteiniclasticum sp. C24MP TaxID=3374101 RepID=UPI0037553997